MTTIKKWNKHEELELIREIKCNHSMEEICKNHNRSNKAIIYRIYNIAYRIINNKKFTME